MIVFGEDTQPWLVGTEGLGWKSDFKSCLQNWLFIGDFILFLESLCNFETQNSLTIYWVSVWLCTCSHNHTYSQRCSLGFLLFLNSCILFIPTNSGDIVFIPYMPTVEVNDTDHYNAQSPEKVGGGGGGKERGRGIWYTAECTNGVHEHLWVLN